VIAALSSTFSYALALLWTASIKNRVAKYEIKNLVDEGENNGGHEKKKAIAF